ncbi:MAG: DUF1517 domain-containing protein [Synechococcales cyanobacterium M58_A2018_015]|nr:DUF1517 domain-containing protein [Synechococcales cyanobacterium M58_A2018_015]
MENYLKNHRQWRFIWLATLVLSLVSWICLYVLVNPDLNGQSRLAQVQIASQKVAQVTGEEHSATVDDPIRLQSGAFTESAVSGGRARGGTFSQPAPSAPALPSRPYSRSYSDYGSGYGSGYGYDYDAAPRRPYPRSDYPQPVPGPVIIPLPAPSYVPSPNYAPDDATDTDGGLDIGFIFLLFVLGFAVLPIVLNYIRLGSQSRSAAPGSVNELTNSIVTVTELQIALLAEARDLQRHLNELAVRAHLETREGVSELLRETVLALLRSPQYWTHARAQSLTVPNREVAAQRFEQLSIEERSKFSTETLVNIGGQVRRQAMPSAPDSQPASYIVVTLLVGTAHDRPLIGEVRSVQSLSDALKRLGAIPPEYLLIYELLWTPQDENDSLSRDELIASYPSLVQL